MIGFAWDKTAFEIIKRYGPIYVRGGIDFNRMQTSLSSSLMPQGLTITVNENKV